MRLILTRLKVSHEHIEAAGEDLEPLGLDWLGDILEVGAEEAEEMEEIRESARQGWE